jgi:hypothetical protein
LLLAHVTDRVPAQRPTGQGGASHAVDRVLCITAALFGIGAFLFALRGVDDPRNDYPGWVLPFGIVCLIAGLTTASFITWRGRSN